MLPVTRNFCVCVKSGARVLFEAKAVEIEAIKLISQLTLKMQLVLSLRLSITRRGRGKK
jgi:hypothetical protein